MRKKLHFLAILCFLSIFSIQLFPQAGALDETFNGTGIQLYEFGEVHDNAYEIITLSDTSSIILGSSSFDGAFVGILFRVKENGDVDTDFGSDDGYTMIHVEGTYATYPREMLRLTDGSYLVAGTMALDAISEDFFAARFLSDGTLDINFGENGYFVSNYSVDQENCHAMAVQPDGKILLGGQTYEGVSSQYLITRLNSNGLLDTGFGTNGYTMIDSSPQGECIWSLGLLSNGNIVGVGYGNRDDNGFFGEWATMVKLYSDGTPMTSFGDNGVLRPSVFTDYSTAHKMRVRNDSLFVTGTHDWSAGGGLEELFLTKMDSSGVADPAFGNSGIQLTRPDGNPYNQGMDLLLSGEGKIYTCGKSGLVGYENRDFILVRYLADGSYDPSFGADGIVLTDIRPDWDEAYSMGMQSDGKLILTGMSSGSSTSGDNRLPVVRYLNDYTPIGAAFHASSDFVCAGSSLNFIDESPGNIVSWEWTFEGGTPSTSTDQNPTVTYNTEGVYDVQLTVTHSNNDEYTSLITDYIHVVLLPAEAILPSGPTDICNNEDFEYFTNPVEYAAQYVWEVIPADAGTLNGNDTVVIFQASETWSGDFVIRVAAGNVCGNGNWSEELSVSMLSSPEIFNLEGGGEYCEGSDGAEITLSGSETGVEYELYLDYVATGIVAIGTGSEISFGMIAEEGFYTANATNASCEMSMNNQVEIVMMLLPTAPATPTGAAVICLETTSDYESTGGSEYVDSYEWGMSPEEAGTITGNELQATVTWNSAFNGIATISLYGINDCGAGEASAIEVSVGAPNPQIEGEAMVCDWSASEYQVADNEGSSYTWEVTGGTIIEGEGTYMVTVSWEGEGSGTLAVSEETADGCEGDSEMFEVVIDDCTGVGEDNLQNSVSISPNPANEKVVIKADIKIESVIIYSINGEKIETLAAGDQKINLNVSGFKSGVYLVMIQTQRGIVTKRLVVK